MHEITKRPAAPLTLVGDPHPWVRDGAVVGGATAYLGAAAGLFGFGVHPWLLACALSGVACGALLGSVAPAVLERLRGRLPLPVIAMTIPVVSAAIATSIALMGSWATGAPQTPAIAFAAVAAFFQAGLFWLPYTIASVMRLPRWPVVASAIVVAPMTGLLAAEVFFIAMRTLAG